MTDHLLGPLEAVELDEQLVERLVLLAVEAVAGALGTDCINRLVNEVLARPGEQPADTGSAKTAEHLDERGGAGEVEVRPRLVRDRLRQQGLAGPGRPVDGARPSAPSPRACETRRVTQEIDDLHQSARTSSTPATSAHVARELAPECEV